MNNGTAYQRRQGRRASIGTGTTSLLVIFTILCLTTLALLSLSTATRNQRISQRSFELIHGRTAADGAAAERLADIDAALADLHSQYAPEQLPAPEAYYVAAERALQGVDCQVDTKAGTVTFTLPINEKNELVTQLQLLVPGQGRRYTVVAQVMQPSESWVPEGGNDVWQG